MFASRKPGAAVGVARLSIDAWLERLLVFVAAASLAGIGLGLVGAFVAPLVLAVAIVVTWIYHRKLPEPIGSDSPLRFAHLVLVLLVALALRLPPHPYVLGGQDQGVYVNMAAELVHTRDIAVVDPEFDRLEKAGVLASYVADNHDFYLPGVYTSDDARPHLVFQFYHLFPVWLALFGGLFGLAASGYALSFLSLVSLLFFQRLATQLTASARLGTAAGVLLALNPLHAFFSKFPVTEIPTLGFSCAAFAFLAMSAGAEPARRRVRWLGLSALAMLCLFLTRISGFMYLPLVLAIALGALTLDPDKARARAIAGWSLATVLAYAASVGYGLLWSRPYSITIYQEAFSLVLGSHWPQVLLVAAGSVALGWTAIWRAPEGGLARTVRALLPRLSRLMGPGLVLVVAWAAYKAWQLGFTDRYASNAWLSQFPGVVAQGWQSFAHVSLVVVALYLSPWLFLAFLAIAQLRLPVPGRYLLFFLCCFVAYAGLLNWTVPYQPYYARYFVSELVPYALLLAVCALAWLHRPLPRRLLATGLGLAGAYFLVLSALQVGKSENAGARESIAALAALAGDEDVILFDKVAPPGFHPLEVKPTLVYTFGRHVISVDSPALADVSYVSGLARAYDRVLLVTAAEHAPAGFTAIGRIRLQADGFGQVVGPPMRLQRTMDATFNVFRLDQVGFRAGNRLRVPLDLGRSSPDRGSGWQLQGERHRLPEGSYLLVLHGAGSLAKEPVLLELVRGGATVSRRAQAGALTSPGGAMAWMEFDVAAGGAPDVSVRVRGMEASRTTLHDYTITRLR
jgi:hypothetical protein